MKLHIAEQQGQITLNLRSIKKLTDGSIRLKASDWKSKDDNFYIDITQDELRRINAFHSSTPKAIKND